MRSAVRLTTSPVWRRSSSVAVGIGEGDVEVGADHRQRVAQLVRRLLDEAALALERVVDAAEHVVEGVGQLASARRAGR